ncbi:Uma2 family endonuclease [Calycomorphotria hydatis]|uniref:Putative restriction endonuclease domain-containing protein n=1 Tax=Calycomorphotria hydatis TaxID=2528027 RepID=A0A517TEF9_9PLAN|nr:Uma2 family endonuclease [Calycomorphotria hydatis]QDT66754.1 hypothetical protein V22_40250 [Calycomorphotria hydatis]
MNLDNVSPLLAGAMADLKSGDHLTREEFHSRYEQTPEGFHAELIKGIVYVQSPVSATHGEPHSMVSGWLFNYVAKTPGIRSYSDSTVFLDPISEPQPDVCLCVEGGNSRLVERINEKGQKRIYIEGPPELVVEVAVSSADIDLYEKKEDYERAGVLEYVLMVLDDSKVHWWHRDASTGKFGDIDADGEGVFRSREHDGLWLNTKALLAGDVAGVITTLEQGLEQRNKS